MYQFLSQLHYKGPKFICSELDDRHLFVFEKVVPVGSSFRNTKDWLEYVCDMRFSVFFFVFFVD